MRNHNLWLGPSLSAVLAGMFLMGCSNDDAPASTSEFNLDEEGCLPAVKFKLGPSGAVFTHKNATIEAGAGDLTEEVELEIAQCPGAVGRADLQHQLNYEFSKTIGAPADGGVEADAGVADASADDEPGTTQRVIVSLPMEPHPSFPPMRIRRVGQSGSSALPLAEGKWLKYCLNIGKPTEGDTNSFIVFHDDKVAPNHPDHFYSATNPNWTPDEDKKCVAFDHLSWFHHFIHHVAKAVSHAAKKVAKKAADVVKSLFDPCADCKNAGDHLAELLTCSNPWAKAELDVECIVQIDEEFPGLIAWTPAICTAAVAVTAALCGEIENLVGISSEKEKFVDRLCKGIHLCD